MLTRAHGGGADVIAAVYMGWRRRRRRCDYKMAELMSAICIPAARSTPLPASCALPTTAAAAAQWPTKYIYVGGIPKSCDLKHGILLQRSTIFRIPRAILLLLLLLSLSLLPLPIPRYTALVFAFRVVFMRSVPNQPFKHRYYQCLTRFIYTRD